MASSSSSSWRYHVFPSFRGQDVRKSFLSHLRKELGRKSIDTFIDNSIERSLPIDPALLLAIKESKISIVIFSKNYASSTWCLNELVEIHKCFKELKQMVIPIFYDVAPSDVSKQTGEFGKLFKGTCKGKPEDHKQRWMQALRDVAKMAGYDLLNWPDEANLIDTITKDVSNKLVTPSSDLGDVGGLEAHLERLSSMLCLESEEARMVGIAGPSGIGKSTIGRALSSQYSSKFHHHAILTYERTTIVVNDSMKLSWEQQFLSKILDQNDIKIDKLGEVEKRLKHKKVFIVLDDVDELELLKTLVGKTEWFGPGSRIIVITQNRQLLKAHEIDHIYEVEFPSKGLALEMLCRYAFGKNSAPDGFRELAVEVAKLAGNLPLGLSALGSSLKGRGKDEWVEMMPRLRNDLDGKIGKTLRVSYDRLDKTDQELFLAIACFFKGKKVSVIEDLFGKIGLRTLADKFLIRITPKEAVEMHDLLTKLGIEIDREESERQTSRRRFLTNADDIRDVLTENNGNKSVLGISFKVTEPFSIDENSFKGMHNLQYIIIHCGYWVIKYTDIRLDLPQGLNYLPRKLKLLKWNTYPAKCLPSNFNAKYLVKLTMRYSKLEKLWEGNQPLKSLKKMDMRYSEYLKEIPNLSNAINLEVLNLQGCKSLVTLPHLNLESLKYFNLKECCQLRNFPQISMIMTNSFAQGIKIEVEDCLWNMASSSSSSWRYHVFPSFSGQDVRKSFLSHLLKELGRKSIDTFIDDRIERSLPIAPALLLALKESKISIVIFSKNYASSTWCLNELVAIHKCFKVLKQMVIPIFYDVAPYDVGKQTGEFGELFKETCKGKPEDHKQSWMQALSDVAKIAGHDLLNGPDEGNLIEAITNYVSNKLFTPSSDVGDFVGLEAHLERLSSMLCLESEEARMVGIVGPSGIGKSTIGRDLYSQHFSKFHHHAIVTFKRTINDDYGMKLSWEQQFLSKILGQNDIKIDKFGEVEKRLKHKKVLIVLDDVDELELLKTLVGKTEWFGPGSRIIVITQNRQLLKAHEIDHIYEVEFPSKGLALEMLCRYAFGKNSAPDGFRELAVEVAKLAGNLPLGLSVLGSSLKGKGKDEWMKMLPRLRNDLDGKIEKTLRVSYDRLDKTDQELFLSIACFFKGKKVSVIEDLFGDIGLTTLADKFLIRITPEEAVEMHDLLQKLGIEIDREESERQPSRRRFLTNADDIRDVLTENNGNKSVLGISFKVTEPFSIDENSFKGMPNLQYIIIHCSHWVINYTDIRLDLHQGLNYLPRKLKLLEWDNYLAKCLPSNFNAKNLVILKMIGSNLEKLWEGNQPLKSLKKMDMRYSEYLKEIPDLSNAINLEVLNLRGCESLVTLPHLNLESLKVLNLKRCCQLRNFPQISMIMTNSFAQGIEIEVEDCLWNKNLRGPSYLDCLMKCIPSKFRPEHFVELKVSRIMPKKLWEGVQSLESLVKLELSLCMKLTEFPDLSKATNLERLIIRDCESLVRVPSTIGNLQKLKEFEMSFCDGLEVLPIDLNLASLSCLQLSMCLELRTFPQISKSIKTLNLSYTAIEEVPCCIDNFSRLTSLTMSSCKSLKNICPKIFRLTHLKVADFSYCEMLTMEGHFSCIPLYGNIEKRSMSFFNFRNCSKLDGNARERILRSCFKFMVLPAGEVPTYFKHRASGNNLTITLPQSSLSQEFLRFQACVVVGHSIKDIDPILNVHLYFNDEYEYEYEVTEFDRLGNFDDYDEMVFEMGNMDHLVSCSFKFRPTVLPSKLDVNDVKFKFSSSKLIKGCGVQLLSVSPSPDISSGRSETEYNQQFREKADVVETGRSKKRMRMTSGTSEEYFNLPFGQIVADTGSSYPSSVEVEEALITELQDAEIPMVDKSWKERAFKLSEPLPWDQ